VSNISGDAELKDYSNYYFAVASFHIREMLDKNGIKHDIIIDDDPNTGLNLMAILMISGGALVLILAAVMVAVLAKKKTAAPIPAAPIPAPEPAPVFANSHARQASIKSLAEQHSGVAAPLGKKPVIIGRDSSVCKIIFKEDTPGVSSKHCQIYFDSDKNEFVLTDLGSSYGTFLMNGQQLAPNTPAKLRTKESFYLASPSNTFIVDVE
jgi:hypothetical protein